MLWNLFLSSDPFVFVLLYLFMLSFFFFYCFYVFYSFCTTAAVFLKVLKIRLHFFLLFVIQVQYASPQGYCRYLTRLNEHLRGRAAFFFKPVQAFCGLLCTTFILYEKKSIRKTPASRARWALWVLWIKSKTCAPHLQLTYQVHSGRTIYFMVWCLFELLAFSRVQ